MRRLAVLSIGIAAALAVAGCEQPAAPAQSPQGYPPGAQPEAPNPGQWSPQGNPGQANPGPWGQSPGAPGPGSPGPWSPGPGTPANPGQWSPGPQGGAPPGPFPQGGAPQGQLAPPPSVLPNGPPVMRDPINDVDLPWLRAAAGGVLQELVAALPPASRARVENIPFVTDATVGEVNAYAACNEQHMPLMAMTDGILQIESYIAQMRATDEVFGTQKLDGYLRYLAQHQKPGEPIVGPPPGLVDPAQHADYRKVVREHQLLEEQMAFVLGHELAHHHLGHTGCANGQSGKRDVTLTDVFRKAARVVPGINQPNELWADEAGVWNLLTAGARRPGYHWTETGALLTLDFFSRLDKLTVASIVFSFESSHPNPALRVGPVQQAASRWRASGGAGAWQAPILP